MKNKKYDERHGGPYDRGYSDSYYRRSCAPHYYKGATGTTERVEIGNMNYLEIEAYVAGFKYNEEVDMMFKDYGWGDGRY